MPRFVKIWMTPLAARDPYIDAPAAPLMISNDSMSSAEMSLKLAVVITLSTMTRGVSLPEIELAARSMICDVVPGSPLLLCTLTPGTLPTR